jgi:thiol-disulfide isomerase/thioredoxin
MRKLLGLLCFVFVAASASAQSVTIIKFDDFIAMSSKQNDTTYVFNFWATWCKPCIEELPAFETANSTYSNDKVKVILISLDFKRQIETVNKFIADKQLKSQVYLLDEVNYNKWIDRVDTSWTGAIPATVIINNKKQYRKFHEQSFTRKQLQEAIEAAKK